MTYSKADNFATHQKVAQIAIRIIVLLHGLAWSRGEIYPQIADSSQQFFQECWSEISKQLYFVISLPIAKTLPLKWEQWEVNVRLLCKIQGQWYTHYSEMAAGCRQLLQADLA